MALTQTATIPGPGPSWDEEVVPALRKRLESESRTIARRISAISVTSLDESPNTTYGSEYAFRDLLSTSNSSYQSNAASKMARPSLQQTRTDPQSSPMRTSPAKPPSARTRTYSQPWAPDSRPGSRANGMIGSRAASPRQDPRPTRIPKPTRGRAGSNSSHNYSPYEPTQSPPPDADLWVLHEKPQAVDSRSTISVASRQGSGLLHEQAPFNGSSATPSNDHSSYDTLRTIELDPPRPSIDSEDHPYEHWYRGDVSRNGGVGELKVAKRKEMLDIANYGHALSSRQAAQALEERRQRRRADSVGPTNRQSFYMEDDGLGQVKDENPLTDIEGDMSDIGNLSDHYPPYRRDTVTPTQNRPSSRQQQQASSIPTSTRKAYEPTPIQITRGASEPPSLPSTSTSTPKSAQKRAASPILPSSPSSSTTKRSRTQAAMATRAKKEAAKKERDQLANRRSVAQYPTPGDDMRDAIPEWTQPVPKEGNWDEVVLPVVARKKGLDGHYEKADGSPRPKLTTTAVEPAPGTFGYDHTKYRPPRRDSDDPDSIPMDEFGIPKAPRRVEEEGEEQSSRRATLTTSHDRTQLPVRSQPPLSPAPFSDYAPSASGPPPRPVPNGTKVEMDLQAKIPDDIEDAGGCCKCVVM